MLEKPDVSVYWKKEVAIAHRYELSLTFAERVMPSSCLVKYGQNIFLLSYSGLNVDRWFLKIIQVVINQIIMKKYNTKQHKKKEKTNRIKRNFWWNFCETSSKKKRGRRGKK